MAGPRGSWTKEQVDGGDECEQRGGDKTCSRSEVEGSRTIGRIRNIPLDFRVFITISRNMCYQYHMFLKTQWKSLKSHLVIKLKFHEFKLVSHIYANFLNVNLTIHVNP